jgi:hypothetical protein
MLAYMSYSNFQSGSSGCFKSQSGRSDNRAHRVSLPPRRSPPRAVVTMNGTAVTLFSCRSISSCPELSGKFRSTSIRSGGCSESAISAALPVVAAHSFACRRQLPRKPQPCARTSDALLSLHDIRRSSDILQYSLRIPIVKIRFLVHANTVS